MKIREFQQRVADTLNTCEELVQGGCKAFAEDQLDIVDELNQQLSMASGLAVVVSTPEFSRNGCREDGIPVEGVRMGLSPVCTGSVLWAQIFEKWIGICKLTRLDCDEIYPEL